MRIVRLAFLFIWQSGRQNTKEQKMTDEVGFVSMAGPKASGTAPEVGVGMLGYAFIGKAHGNAFKKILYMVYPPPAIPNLISICGRNEDARARQPNATATPRTTPIGA